MRVHGHLAKIASFSTAILNAVGDKPTILTPLLNHGFSLEETKTSQVLQD